MVVAFATVNANAANVVSRNSRASISRAPTVTAQTTVTSNEIVENVEQPAVQQKPESIIENKSSQFEVTLASASTTATDTNATSLAEMVRAQRAALDAASNAFANAKTLQTGLAGKNNCDVNLRTCMTEKCGTLFTGCASDTDTMFGTKLDSCRRNTNCSANEFSQLSAEIKADRTANIKLKSFNDILACGQDYDSCIIEQCGTTYANCLGKSASDTAISKCASIANRCKSLDNGLASRTMNVFGTLRQSAEKQISIDEQKLYALRDQMKSACARLGAMFDERTLDCVYTVNFRAGDDATLYASKKLYAGDTFDCTPNWFGVDVTTFKENAYRETRAQTSASSAMLGAGAGMAVGALTSGAVGRAIETQKAKNALKAANDDSVTTDKLNTSQQPMPANTAQPDTTKEQEKKDARQEQQKQKKQQELCDKDKYGSWSNTPEPICRCLDDRHWNGEKCIPNDPQKQKYENCEASGGHLYDNKTGCSCPGNAKPDENWNCPK